MTAYRPCLGIAAMLLAGCAKVHVFEAYPRTICPGDRVRLTWAATDEVTIEPKPRFDPAPEAGWKPPEAASLEAIVSEETPFVLRVEGLFKDGSATRTISIAGTEAKGFGELASCNAAATAIESRFVLDSQLSAAVEVAHVRNVSGRALHVLKEGHDVALAVSCPAAASSTATTATGATASTEKCEVESDTLNGHVARGTWLLRSPLAAGETCDAALRSVRQRLRVELTLRCGG